MRKREKNKKEMEEEERLNDYEKANLQLIQTLEKE